MREWEGFFKRLIRTYGFKDADIIATSTHPPKLAVRVIYHCKVLDKEMYVAFHIDGLGKDADKIYLLKELTRIRKIHLHSKRIDAWREFLSSILPKEEAEYFSKNIGSLSSRLSRSPALSEDSFFLRDKVARLMEGIYGPWG